MVHEEIVRKALIVRFFTVPILYSMSDIQKDRLQFQHVSQVFREINYSINILDDYVR